MAPYCATPRDYLSDTALLLAMGFLVSQHGQLGAIPPPPFLRAFPLESIREVEVRYHKIRHEKGTQTQTFESGYFLVGVGVFHVKG